MVTMRYKILHNTSYVYSDRVSLNPHWIRLRSRSNHHQTLHYFNLDIHPQPLGQSAVLDLEGNAVEKIWFHPQEFDRLEIRATSEVETHCVNPFNYLLEPWAIELPIDYPSTLMAGLSPYFSPRNCRQPMDFRVYEWAVNIAQSVNHQVTAFLMALNQQIYQNCEYEIRDTGPPLPPGITWQQKRGTCRDFAVLFMEACRGMGLAARFVSGYQEGDPPGESLCDRQTPEPRYLHAWVEVYLPGAGWRGYDPTHGLAVGDRHIALVASAIPQNTAPILGTLRTSSINSQMTFDISIEPLN